MAKKCVRYFVSGKVQGVWFRDSTVEQANKIGMTGWVRNLSDGRVEVLASGERNEHEQLHQWLQNGPTLARVSSVESEEADPQNFQDFMVC